MKIELPPLHADPLVEALQVLRLRGTMYTRSRLTAPWGMSIPAMEGCLMFHVVTAGSAELQVDGFAPRRLQRGELALVPQGLGHALVDHAGSATTSLFDLPCEKISERYEFIRGGGGGALTEMVCATVQFDHPAARQLISLLPAVMYVDAASPTHSEWLHSTLAFMAAEANAMRIGGEAIITRLADVLVIQAIRGWIEHDPAAQSGWLRALRDRQIGRAIALIHRDPAADWTLEELARAVAMSRSAFAARFAELVGMPAMQYVAQWRMRLAYSLLQDPGLRMAEIASRLGYASEAAFSRAFKRHNGISPGRARRLPATAGIGAELS